jgi:outer membrane protein OmpA-like peptidoglycan-associated protein/Flp pilus assembly protein TadD
MYLFLGFPGKAENVFLHSQKLDSNNALAKFYLGKLYQDTQRYHKAIKQIEGFLNVVPKDPEGYILLGQIAYKVGNYGRAKKAFETAYSLDPISSEARAGLQRTERTLDRKNRLSKASIGFVWDVGLISKLTPLTLVDDNLELQNDALGAPTLSDDDKLLFTTGNGDRFQIHSLSGDGLHLRRRAASSSAFSGNLGTPNHLLVALGQGQGRDIGAFDALKGTFRSIRQGHCKSPNYSTKGQNLVCLTPGGVLLVDVVSKNVSTLSRETEARHPRFSRDGKKVLLAVGDELVLHDVSSQEAQRVRVPGGKESASYPDISPNGLWVVSGGKGIYLTSVQDQSSILLQHPYLREGRRAIFSADGRGLIFERSGRIYRIELPNPIDRFFAFLQAKKMIQKKRFSAAIRLLNQRKSDDQNSAGYFLLLGQAYFGLNFNEKARMAANRSAQLNPKGWRPMVLLGKLLVARNDLEGASRLFDRSVEFGPNQFEGFLERAKVLAIQGRVEAAIRDYQTAMKKLKPENGFDREPLIIGLLNLYVDSKRVNDALLLLLDHADGLSANTLDLVRESPRYQIIHEDPRFSEIIGSTKTMPVRKGPGMLNPVPDTFPIESPPRIRPMEKKIRSGTVLPRPFGERKGPSPDKPHPRKVEPNKKPIPVKNSKFDIKTPWILSGVLFDFNNSTLKSEFFANLDQVVEVLKRMPWLQVEIQGHTDQHGPEIYNRRLSERRAVAVMKYFVRQGIRRQRLSAKGYGESRPIASNSSRAGRAKNRRVELKVNGGEGVVANRPMPIDADRFEVSIVW